MVSQAEFTASIDAWFEQWLAPVLAEAKRRAVKPEHLDNATRNRQRRYFGSTLPVQRSSSIPTAINRP